MHLCVYIYIYIYMYITKAELYVNSQYIPMSEDLPAHRSDVIKYNVYIRTLYIYIYI